MNLVFLKLLPRLKNQSSWSWIISHSDEAIEQHSHLQRIIMDDTDEKSQLLVHLILRANDFAKIRTGERLRVGRHSDPVAEHTGFGWTLMSLGVKRH